MDQKPCCLYSEVSLFLENVFINSILFAKKYSFHSVIMLIFVIEYITYFFPDCWY